MTTGDMKAYLQFLPCRTGDLKCRAIAALVFQDAGPETDGISALGVKIGSHLRELKARGFWKGREGETLLIPGEGRDGADRIILAGLGERSGFTMDLLENTVRGVGKAMDRMGIRDIGLQIPLVPGLETDFPRHLRSACARLVETIMSAHPGEEEVLRVTAAVDPAFIDLLEDVARELQEEFRGRLDLTVGLDRSVAAEALTTDA